MAEEKMMRLSQVARKLNVGLSTITEYLSSKGHEVDSTPNSKINQEQFTLLIKEFASSIHDKEEASSLTIGINLTETVVIDTTKDHTTRKKEDDSEILIKNLAIGKEDILEEKVDEDPVKEDESLQENAIEQDIPKLKGIKVLGKIDLSEKKDKEENKKEKPEDIKDEKPETVSTDTAKPETLEEKIDKDEFPPKTPKEVIKAKSGKLKGLKVVGKIELPKEKESLDQPVASSDDQKEKRKKRPRKRIASKQRGNGQRGVRRKPLKEEPTDKEIQDQIKATLAKLSGSKKSISGVKYRKEKRSAIAEAKEEKKLREIEESKTIKVTEFISANDLAALMEVSVNEVISTCMNMGVFVSINQRLDAESITFITDEFGYDVEFSSSEDEMSVEIEEDSGEDMVDRAPIVTIMGHVDHGKTSLLDYIRKSNITADEAGGITQHIGAYDVITENGHKIAFLDTPGHEAFTAMRARGAKVTDVVIIVIAADDNVMPQTKEALNHAQVAGVPIVIAINKIDKPNANPEKIKEELSKINVLVEDWGGKYQSQEISAKTGDGINELLEKVLLEAELLELKADPDKKAVGTVIEAELDKGRGYLTTILVQNGTLRIGDIMLAGRYFGKVKAIFDHLGNKLKEAGPSTPIQVLGLAGAPQAGDKFNSVNSEREAREITSKREQIQREQNIRTKKHITLDEIGRRLAIGSFKELNVIIKGDVDGSVEALSDSLLKLSTEEIEINIINKGVGQISESDVLMATASDAVIVGFQVRPSPGARKLADNEEIEIRLYSVIYDAINEIKDAMEGMLAPEFEEIIVGNVEIREIFKITRVGTIAGCMVTDGLIKRKNAIRLIRDGIVTYSGEIGQLKRFKEDVQEVKSGYECGISIKNFNDIKVGDVVESYEQKEIKRTL